jgi:hypothetical protein
LNFLFVTPGTHKAWDIRQKVNRINKLQMVISPKRSILIKMFLKSVRDQDGIDYLRSIFKTNRYKLWRCKELIQNSTSVTPRLSYFRPILVQIEQLKNICSQQHSTTNFQNALTLNTL